MIVFETLFGSDAYTMITLLRDLRNGFWSELRSGWSIDSYRRNLQRAHVERLGTLLNSKDVSGFRGTGTVTVKQSDIIPLIKGELKTIKRNAARSAAATSNTVRRYHLQDIAERVDDILDPK